MPQNLTHFNRFRLPEQLPINTLKSLERNFTCRVLILFLCLKNTLTEKQFYKLLTLVLNN